MDKKTPILIEYKPKKVDNEKLNRAANIIYGAGWASVVAQFISIFTEWGSIFFFVNTLTLFTISFILKITYRRRRNKELNKQLREVLWKE